ncbi:MAG: sensor histidine kinase [Ardenticatenaceae bacterium]|nr:sensor histidine kinase [Ardenticatenaceae bacterium]
MRKRPSSDYNFFLLNVAAFITWGATAVAVTRSITPGIGWFGLSHPLSILFFLIFGILLAFFLSLEQKPFYVHLYFVAQTTLILAIYLQDPPNALSIQTLFYILSAQSMLFLPLQQGFIWVLIFYLITIWGEGHVHNWRKDILVYLGMLGGYVFFAAFGSALAQAIAARRQSQQLLDELQEAHKQLKEYALQVQQLAVSEERNRLAQEMHDALGHRLTVAVVQLEGAQRLIPKEPERAAVMVSTMRQQLKEALAELRQTVADLRLSPTDDVPLPVALTRLTHAFQEATGLTIHSDLPATLPELPASHRHTLFRAAQECLTNVQRHAQAQTVWLTLAAANDTITLAVRDDGQNGAPQIREGHFGLQGLQERAVQLNGRLHLHPHHNGGAQVQLQLPLPHHD